MASTGATSAPGPSAILKLILLGAVVGIPAAFVAWLFLGLVHVLEELLWTDIPDALGRDLPPWWLVLLLPVLGALVVYVARRFLPGDGGHRPLQGIGGPPMPWQHAPSVALAAIGTLAFGAVLGPEAPLIALGSVVGMFVAQQAKLQGPAQNVVAQAGSFSAVSALFGGPLVAGVLFLEGALAAGIGMAFLLPGFVAAAVGYLLFVGLGSWDGLSTSPLSVPNLPAYEGTLVVDLLLAVVVGVLTAVLMGFVRSGAMRVDVFARRPGRMLVALVLGGLAAGLVAIFARLLGGNSQDVLFSGQAAVPDVVAENSGSVLVVLLVAKALGYAICLGCGFRGGPVFPAIFLGVAIATFAVIFLDTSPTWAVAVGAAAGLTAGTGLVFSGLVFSMLLVGTGGLDALPAAVFAGTSAWLVRAMLEKRLGTEPAPAPAG